MLVGGPVHRRGVRAARPSRASEREKIAFLNDRVAARSGNRGLNLNRHSRVRRSPDHENLITRPPPWPSPLRAWPSAAVPAAAADFGTPRAISAGRRAEDGWNQHRRDRASRPLARYDDRGYSQQRATTASRSIATPASGAATTAATYCRKKDGTTGLIIGGAAGALLGREVDGGRDRTLGTILGAAAGALLGKEVDGGTRCR